MNNRCDELAATILRSDDYSGIFGKCLVRVKEFGYADLMIKLC